MSLSACSQVNADLTCAVWVTVHPYLLPPMSLTDGAELSALCIGCWIVAVCGRYLVNRIIGSRS